MKSLGSFFLIATFFLISANNTKAQVAYDVDSNAYDIVTIGAQHWMKQNLRTSRYSDSSMIPDIIVIPKVDEEIFGVLYNYEAVMNGSPTSYLIPSGVQGVCPTGWHVPSDAEWKELERHLGMPVHSLDSFGKRGTNEGGMLKSTDTSHWKGANVGAIDSFAFSAVGTGYYDGTFSSKVQVIKEYTNFYSTSLENGMDVIVRTIRNFDAKIERSRANHDQSFNRAVRCLADSSSTIYTSTKEVEIDKKGTLYPNPNDGSFTIDLERHIENLRISVFDMNGRLIEENQYAGFKTMQYDLNVTPGVYQIVVRSSDEVIQTFKVIKN